MHTLSKAFIARIAVAAMFMIALLPAPLAVTAQAAETSYTDEEYGVTIGWTDQWNAELPTGSSPLLRLDRDSSLIVIITIYDGNFMTPEEGVWFLYQDGDEIIEDRSTENPPHLVIALPDSSLVYTSEAYSLNNGETTVLVSVGTVPVLQQSAVEIMQQDITINGSPVMTGQPIDASGSASVDATAETQPRTSRIGRSTSQTPEPTVDATVEPTTEITRTSRTGSGETVTPEATQAPTEIPTEVPTEIPTEAPTEEVIEADDPGTYNSSTWGYSFRYDTAIWEQIDTVDSPGLDILRLDGEMSTVFFVGTPEYGADPVGCLEGEDAYFSSGSESISDWQVATDANGDPLWFESDELAWGVFNYTFHSSSGEDVEFMDYISCETIPGEDAVLIVQLTTFPETYNDNLDAVLDILDTLEFQP